MTPGGSSCINTPPSRLHGEALRDGQCRDTALASVAFARLGSPFEACGRWKFAPSCWSRFKFKWPTPLITIRPSIRGIFIHTCQHRRWRTAWLAMVSQPVLSVAVLSVTSKLLFATPFSGLSARGSSAQAVSSRDESGALRMDRVLRTGWLPALDRGSRPRSM
ncbi:hypothetical protein BS50DRAFT_184147 [Corynespora cassiicola Philippines]|uniref:Uncharacterized protein n=1 Tax=Corynespora cassiicola Philippines TaxID=1448308 RepID=A0A2T2P6D0_CORCC|nr:hypothetical protein BS50DRAFT_184147 [Corynespora cassiicola Philippines]